MTEVFNCTFCNKTKKYDETLISVCCKDLICAQCYNKMKHTYGATILDGIIQIQKPCLRCFKNYKFAYHNNRCYGCHSKSTSSYECENGKHVLFLCKDCIPSYKCKACTIVSKQNAQGCEHVVVCDRCGQSICIACISDHDEYCTM